MPSASGRDRLQAHAVEAAEQCGGTYVPPVEELRRLSEVLDDWPTDRRLVFADEALVGAKRALVGARQRDEMGDPDRARGRVFRGRSERGFRPLPFVTPISLGPRVLRADTAAVAALTLWQSTLGDW
jgi:16S rRNA (uracil1498-N3)-methyltransferase